MNIDPKKSALLVIDILQGGSGDSIYQGPGASFASKSKKVVEACREAGIPVIFCDDAHIKGIDKELDLWGDHGLEGTAEAQPADFLGLSDEDFVIPKRRYDAFFETDLDLTLRELGVTTLIAIGCDTNICVLHTLAGGYYRGYKSILVEDATFTFLVGTQAQGIEHCQRCFGSHVMSTEELCSELESSR